MKINNCRITFVIQEGNGSFAKPEGEAAKIKSARKGYVLAQESDC
jgi:hypothetical protein